MIFDYFVFFCVSLFRLFLNDQERAGLREKQAAEHAERHTGPSARAQTLAHDHTTIIIEANMYPRNEPNWAIRGVDKRFPTNPITGVHSMKPSHKFTLKIEKNTHWPFWHIQQ